MSEVNTLTLSRMVTVQPTNEFRWHSRYQQMPRILQQKFLLRGDMGGGNTAGFEWRDVPIVIGEETT